MQVPAPPEPGAAAARWSPAPAPRSGPVAARVAPAAARLAYGHALVFLRAPEPADPLFAESVPPLARPTPAGGVTAAPLPGATGSSARPAGPGPADPTAPPRAPRPAAAPPRPRGAPHDPSPPPGAAPRAADRPQRADAPQPRPPRRARSLPPAADAPTRPRAWRTESGSPPTRRGWVSIAARTPDASAPPPGASGFLPPDGAPPTWGSPATTRVDGPGPRTSPYAPHTTPSAGPARPAPTAGWSPPPPTRSHAVALLDWTGAGWALLATGPALGGGRWSLASAFAPSAARVVPARLAAAVRQLTLERAGTRGEAWEIAPSGLPRESTFPWGTALPVGPSTRPGGAPERAARAPAPRPAAAPGAALDAAPPSALDTRPTPAASSSTFGLPGVPAGVSPLARASAAPVWGLTPNGPAPTPFSGAPVRRGGPAPARLVDLRLPAAAGAAEIGAPTAPVGPPSAPAASSRSLATGWGSAPGAAGSALRRGPWRTSLFGAPPPASAAAHARVPTGAPHLAILTDAGAPSAAPERFAAFGPAPAGPTSAVAAPSGGSARRSTGSAPRPPPRFAASAGQVYLRNPAVRPTDSTPSAAAPPPAKPAVERKVRWEAPRSILPPPPAAAPAPTEPPPAPAAGARRRAAPRAADLSTLTEEELLNVLTRLTTRSPEARAILREVRAQVEAMDDLERLRRL